MNYKIIFFRNLWSECRCFTNYIDFTIKYSSNMSGGKE